jgi:hypothetical protein
MSHVPAETAIPLVSTRAPLDEDAWLADGESELEPATPEDWSDLHDAEQDAIWNGRSWRRRAVRSLGWTGIVSSIVLTILIAAASPPARDEIGRWATLGGGREVSEQTRTKPARDPRPNEDRPARTPVTRR